MAPTNPEARRAAARPPYRIQQALMTTDKPHVKEELMVGYKVVCSCSANVGWLQWLTVNRANTFENCEVVI